MALMAYCNMKGKTQGDIKGSITQKGREGSIGVIAMNHSIISPRDAASGLPTGKRMHKPITVTCENEVSTPLLYQALVTNEQITEWKLDFWRPSAAGQEEQYYTVELVNASIASIDFCMPNNKHPDLMKFETYLNVAFTYQKITWTVKKPSNKSASDDWETPT